MLELLNIIIFCTLAYIVLFYILGLLSIVLMTILRPFLYVYGKLLDKIELIPNNISLLRISVYALLICIILESSIYLLRIIV